MTQIKKVSAKPRESFSIRDLAHGLYLRDIVNSLGTDRLPYDESVYYILVKEIIADYNDGLDADKPGLFCTQHEQKETGLNNLVEEDKRFETNCDMEALTNWILRGSLFELERGK
jgi:hypothetical protein